MYETILSPVNYGGLQLKNRIIFAPTTFGLPDEEYLAEIRRLAEGGCAMLIIGDVPVGKSMFEKSLFDAKGFAFYQKIVEIAHKADCKVCAQLHQSDSNMLAMLKYIPAVLTKKLTPDQLREKLNAEVEPYITKMPKRKIEAILAGFGKAAVLAVSKVVSLFLFGLLLAVLLLAALHVTPSAVLEMVRNRPEYEEEPEPTPAVHIAPAEPPRRRGERQSRPAIDIPLDGEEPSAQPEEESGRFTGFFRHKSDKMKTPDQVLSDKEAEQAALEPAPSPVRAKAAPAPGAVGLREDLFQKRTSPLRD